MKTRGDVDGRVRGILVRHIGIPAKQIGGGARLVGDLEMDALDFVEVALELERDFDLAVAGDRLAGLATVDDLVDLVCGLLVIGGPRDRQANASDFGAPGLRGEI